MACKLRKLLEKAKKEIGKAIEKVTVQDKNAFVNINYSRMARLFLIQFYNSGLMIKKLTIEEINKLIEKENACS